MGVMIEHYAGAFPTWLSPVQAVILPVSEKFKDYAKEVEMRFIASGIRAKIDDSDESLGKRIRTAAKQKVPYILVMGEKEAADNSVSVRTRGEENQETMKIEEFLEKIKKEIKEKK